ncbi:Protein of unknown function [Methanosarcina thermophila]|jgi:ABC-type antimicrobial peptide transport system ATPase subunit|uniref:DUF2795 domain-containing protein n=3 Tax=Methanosarcina thermophila TaxID=2210 RepID=A0A1I6XU17_METTE|nr:DUF2795 domain-containing protein [Methanosarcina thermophila]ALK05715.1 MAG: hypothetical protein AAY43_08400 [Methanosarcina sp. 795]AKB12832.1 hypothetical protein MSTHT_1074 [Methanosarcina thermophila TM-1]AKB16547.1 hypothetical protein MSTHC_2229 [Methanosarcina thermophila CHTI-55]NLU56853.1 DUF2795 domain-containing protein [Methanosarcina thermophila]SFT41830.1 Protein of unknown function [Methanosarcina thermophila]
MGKETKSEFIVELPMGAQKILQSMDFPVKRNEIIAQAKKSGALPDILRELGLLPDKQYNSAEEVAEELHMIYMGVPS